MSDERQRMTSSDGQNSIAYQHEPRGTVGVVFLHGFRSDMTGSKAVALAEKCRELGLSFTALDYRGHGQSSGHYTDFVVSDWLADVLQIIDNVTSGPLILVGSSLGGWLMLLAAKLRPERVKALIGIAPAPEFPRRRVLANATPEKIAEYTAHNRITEQSLYGDEPNIFTKALIEDSDRHPIFGQPFSFNGPVRILQGMRDTAVPPENANLLMGIIDSSDIEVTLVKNADHSVSSTAQLKLLCRLLEELV